MTATTARPGHNGDEADTTLDNSDGPDVTFAVIATFDPGLSSITFDELPKRSPEAWFIMFSVMTIGLPFLAILVGFDADVASPHMDPAYVCWVVCCRNPTLVVLLRPPGNIHGCNHFITQFSITYCLVCCTEYRITGITGTCSATDSQHVVFRCEF